MRRREDGRQTNDDGGMHKLTAAAKDLSKKGVLRGLFQPTAGTRPLFEALQPAHRRTTKPVYKSTSVDARHAPTQSFAPPTGWRLRRRPGSAAA